MCRPCPAVTPTTMEADYGRASTNVKRPHDDGGKESRATFLNLGLTSKKQSLEDCRQPRDREWKDVHNPLADAPPQTLNALVGAAPVR